MASYNLTVSAVNQTIRGKYDHVKLKAQFGWSLDLDVPKGFTALKVGQQVIVSASGLAVDLAPVAGGGQTDFASWLNALVDKVQSTEGITNAQAFDLLQKSLYRNIKLVGECIVTDLEGNVLFSRGNQDDAPVGKLNNVVLDVAVPTTEDKSVPVTSMPKRKLTRDEAAAKMVKMVTDLTGTVPKTRE